LEDDIEKRKWRENLKKASCLSHTGENSEPKKAQKKDKNTYPLSVTSNSDSYPRLRHESPGVVVSRPTLPLEASRSAAAFYSIPHLLQGTKEEKKPTTAEKQKQNKRAPPQEKKNKFLKQGFPQELVRKEGGKK
jgi:hypothetical protein